MAISFDKALGVHPHAMLIRSQRAEMLATNIANADTPGYKAKDIDFASALKTAKSNQRSRHFTYFEKSLILREVEDITRFTDAVKACTATTHKINANTLILMRQNVWVCFNEK